MNGFWDWILVSVGGGGGGIFPKRMEWVVAPVFGAKN